MANESFYGDGPMARALSDWLPREPSASVLVHVWAVAAVITATAWMIATVAIGARALRDSMAPTGARRGAAPGNKSLRDGTGPEHYGAAAPATTPPPVSRLLPGGWCATAAPRPQAPVATDPTAPSEATQGCGTQQRAKFAASAHFYEAGAGGVGGGAPAPGGGPPAFCYTPRGSSFRDGRLRLSP